MKSRANPIMIRWAREQSGFDARVVADKLGIPEERLRCWENGAETPSIPQLRSMAEAYKRPMAAFYLAEVPRSFNIGTDFRRLPHDEPPRSMSPGLLLELRSAEYHRDVALDLSTEISDTVQEFSFTTKLTDDEETCASRLRQHLNPQFVRRARNYLEVFRTWAGAVESSGVLVFQTTRVDVEEARGFSISANVFPVVAVNGKDWWAARLFTLLHEVTHISLHSAGLCDLSEFGRDSDGAARVEVFCNHVAAATLVSRDELLSHHVVIAVPRNRVEWPDEQLRYIARDFGVSPEVILRRLLYLGRTSEAFYRETRDRYQLEREQDTLRRRRPDSKIARNVPNEIVRDLGRPFVSIVLKTYGQERISLSEVASYLDVRTKHIPKIEELSRLGS